MFRPGLLIKMTGFDIARQRLRNQRLTGAGFEKASDVVRWLGAVQAQDYAAAKWAVAQRANSLTDAVMDQALADGTILRTHVLRPTWHFVTPKDIRWMIALSAPRIHAANAHRHRQLGLDAAVFRRSGAAIEKALRDRHLTRDELRVVLRRERIAVDDSIRMGHLMMHAELEGIVCSGPRRGKQFTYALLDERARRARTCPRDEALAGLADRYFTSRGPASVRDFAKWSWLTVGDATRGLDAIKGQLQQDVVRGRSYWFSPSTPTAPKRGPTAHLLPVYDEYLSSYDDRSALVSSKYRSKLAQLGALGPIIVVDGQIVGVWKRALQSDAVSIVAHVFTRLDGDAKHALRSAAERYGEFLDMQAVIVGPGRAAAV